MNPRSIILILSAIALSATILRANITYQASFLGTTPPNGASFSSIGGALISTVKSDVPILGVSGGAASSEIDWGQSLTVSFNDPTAIGHLQIGLLFGGPEFGDHHETALFSVNGLTYSLQAYSGGAHYSRDGVWLYDLAGDNGVDQHLYGMFTLNDPFQGQSLSSFTLKSGGAGSDYGLMSFNTTAPSAAPLSVPDGGSSILLMASALGMLAACRRHSRSPVVS